MTTVSVSRTIDAPVHVVFKAVTDIARLPETNPDIVGVEFLSDSHSGVGTRFRETRRMNGKEHHTELELTELVENERARMVSDSHGTTWDSVFTITPEGDKTRLSISMDARAHKLLPKLLNPLFKRLLAKGVARHLDAVANYCESKSD